MTSDNSQTIVTPRQLRATWTLETKPDLVCGPRVMNIYLKLGGIICTTIEAFIKASEVHGVVFGSIRHWITPNFIHISNDVADPSFDTVSCVLTTNQLYCIINTVIYRAYMRYDDGSEMENNLRDHRTQFAEFPADDRFKPITMVDYLTEELTEEIDKEILTRLKILSKDTP